MTKPSWVWSEPRASWGATCRGGPCAAGGRHRIVATHHVREPFEASNTDWAEVRLAQNDGAQPVSYSAVHGMDAAVICAGQLSTSAVLSLDPMSSVLMTLRIMTNALEAAAQNSPSACCAASVRARDILLLSRPAVEADMLQGDPPAQWFGVGWMHRYVEQQLRWACGAPGHDPDRRWSCGRRSSSVLMTISRRRRGISCPQ